MRRSDVSVSLEVLQRLGGVQWVLGGWVGGRVGGWVGSGIDGAVPISTYFYGLIYLSVIILKILFLILTVRVQMRR